MSTNIRVEGNTDLSHIVAKGDISSFYYKGYTYKNIHLDGSYKNDIFTGKAAINDLTADWISMEKLLTSWLSYNIKGNSLPTSLLLRMLSTYTNIQADRGL